MRKAKIMLSALGVLAVVGGALAFKSNKTFNGKYRCTTYIAAPTTFCPNFAYTAAVVGPPMACTLINAPGNAPCALLTRAVLIP